MSGDELPTLGYAAPEIFFDGEYCARTPQTLLAGMICLGIASFTVVQKAVHRADVPAEVVGIFGGLFGLIGGWCAWTYCTNQRHAVRVTADGVEGDNRSWPWADIGCIGAVRQSSGDVYLYLQVRGRMLPYSLLTTPALTAGEYAALRGTLDRYIALSGLRVETRDLVDDHGGS